MLEILTFGGLTLYQGGVPVTALGSRKAEALLVYLAVNGRAIARDVLGELFWPEHPAQKAQGNLRRVIYDLRRRLAPYLHIDRHTIVIRQKRVRLDTNRFQVALDQVSQQGGLRSPEAVAVVESAVTLYKGPFLHGFPSGKSRGFEAWLRLQQESLQQQMITALRQLVAWYVSYGPFERGLSYADWLLRLDPFREASLRQLLRLLMYTDQRAKALDYFETSRQLIWDELGIEPAPETIALYETILAGELVVPDSVPFPSGPFALSWPDFLSAEAEPRPAAPFVARGLELADLEKRLTLALEGRGQIVFLAGEPGAGKTAMAAAFSRAAAETRPELLVAWGRCQAHVGRGDPYQPFRAILAMLTGDVEAHWAADLVGLEQARRLWQAMPATCQSLLVQGPDLIGRFITHRRLMQRLQFALGPDVAAWYTQLLATTERELAIGDGGEQSHYFEQLRNVLADISRKYPLILILDDLQWVDTASLDLLFHLSRNLNGARILLLGTFRPDEVALGRRSRVGGEQIRHPLRKVLAECQRSYGRVIIDLDKVTPAEGQAFVDALLDIEPNRLSIAFRQALARHTNGQPLFTVEVLRALQARGSLVRDDAGRWVEGSDVNWKIVPARVEGAIAERIGRLDRALRQTLIVACVEGESFTAEVLAQVLEIPEWELVRRLKRELDVKHRLVGELGLWPTGVKGLHRFQFRHNLFRQYLYDDLGKMERELLHGLVGGALESVLQGQESEMAAHLGWHFEEAGNSAKAIDYLLVAGDRARHLYANDEAIDLYERALTLLTAQSDYERAARTLMKLGLTYHNSFAFRQAQGAYDEGFRLWRQAGSTRRSEPASSPPHPLRLSWLKPETLDPALARTVYAVEVSELLFSGLIRLTPELDLAPDIARRWDLRGGGRRYLFHLRRDAVWSDGTPVTARDFEYAWRRVLDPRTKAPSAAEFYPIRGAETFHQGDLRAADRLGIRAIDEVTLVVDLERPTSYFPFLLTLPMAFPVPRHVIEKSGDNWARAETIVTNGAFRLEAWTDDGSVMSLTRNPDFHLSAAGNVEEMLLFMERGWWSEGWSKRMAKYTHDELDIIFLQGGTAKAIERARVRHADDFLPLPMLGLSFLQFDITRSPFNDIQVRQAMVLAIDKESYVITSAGHVGAPAMGGMVPPNMPGHVPDAGLPFDPARARKLLAEAGFPGGRGFPDVAVVTAGGPPVKEMLKQWQEQLGVTIRHETIGWDDYFGNFRRAKPHIAGLTWTAEYLDPRVFLNTKDIRAIWPKWHHEVFAQLEARAAQQIDQSRRIQLYQEMDRLLVQEAVTLPLNYTRRVQLVKPWVTRLPVSPIRLITHCRDTVIVPHG